MKILQPINAVLIWLVAYLFSSSIIAETIYKSVDKNDNITYSSAPTDNYQKTDEVDLLPPPSEDAVNAAQQRHQQNIRAEKILDENRQKRAQKVTEDNRIKREKRKRHDVSKTPEKAEQQEGPYYGIPGHGILVLPAGPQINRQNTN